MSEASPSETHRSPAGGRGAGTRRALVLLALFALGALAFAVRTTNAPLVLGESGVHMTVPGDPYYHLRRIAFNVERFPAALDHDPYLNYPHGAPAVWPAMFDWSAAAAIRLVVGGDDPAAVERAAMWIPPVLGAATVIAVAALGWACFGAAGGLLAGGLLAVLPAHVLHSQLGQLDHHVAVALLTSLLVAVGIRLLRPGGDRLALGALLGAAQAAAIGLWPGALLHVGTVLGVALGWALFARTAEDAVRRATVLALACGVTAALLAPASLGRSWNEFGSWTPLALSNFQPVFFAAGCVALLAAAATWRSHTAGRTRALRVTTAALGTGAALALALLVIPGLADAVTYAAGWFGKEEEFQTHVTELRPFDAATGVSRFTILWLAFPVAWLVLAWHTLRSRQAADLALLLGVAAAFGVLAVMQRRFGNTFSVVFALVWAGAAVSLWRATRDRRAARVGLAALGVVLALLTADSLYGFYREREAAMAQARRNPTVAKRGPLGVRHRLIDAGATWLRGHSPETAGWLDPEVQPEYAVLSAWDAGHMVRYRARRPLVADNFGVYGGRANYEAVDRYFLATDEEAAIGVLDALGVRYVLADGMGAGMRRRYPGDAMATRLARRFGSAAADGAHPGLGRHRLLWHQRSGGDRAMAAEAPAFALGVWETVPGARIEGSGTPRARFELHYTLHTASGREHLYRRALSVDGEGRYRFTVPYPTDRAWSEAMRGSDAYRLTGSFGERAFTVPERAIAAGAVVAGPDLTP